jgi:hypothetical protein
MTDEYNLVARVIELENRVNKLEAHEKDWKPSRFKKPTPMEASIYAGSIGFHNFSGTDFVDYYEEVGWKVGKTKKPMKDWQAAVRLWKRKHDKENPQQQNRGGHKIL